MQPITKRILKAQEVVSSIAAKKPETREPLELFVAGALEATGGEVAFLIIPTPQDPYQIHTVKSCDGRAVPPEHQVVSRELVDHARDMKDPIVSRNPFAVMKGVKGEYTVNGDTLGTIPGLRSVIVAPLVLEDRMVGALVIHERNRTEPFTLDDRRGLEPLIQFGAKVIADSVQRVREDLAAPGPAKKKRPGDRVGRLVGESKRFLEAVEEADMVADTDLPVLLTGESGTGKELFAERIHSKSLRSAGPLVRVNMGCLGELVVAELFGYMKGAFTGAIADKIGLIEQAKGGTILLDELGELGLEGQAALLRFLQDRYVRPLGGTEKRVDVRIIAATNRDLEAMVNAKTFKFDLLMRLTAIHIELPPLRERDGDLALLVPMLVEKIAAKIKRKPKPLTLEAMKKIERYEWPGNIRELENALAGALVFSKNAAISEEDLKIRAKSVDASPSVARLSAEQKGYFRYALALHRCENDKTQALQLAETSRTRAYEFIAAGKEIDPGLTLLPEWYRAQMRSSR